MVESATLRFSGDSVLLIGVLLRLRSFNSSLDRRPFGEKLLRRLGDDDRSLCGDRRFGEGLRRLLFGEPRRLGDKLMRLPGDRLLLNGLRRPGDLRLGDDGRLLGEEPRFLTGESLPLREREGDSLLLLRFGDDRLAGLDFRRLFSLFSVTSLFLTSLSFSFKSSVWCGSSLVSCIG